MLPAVQIHYVSGVVGIYVDNYSGCGVKYKLVIGLIPA